MKTGRDGATSETRAGDTAEDTMGDYRKDDVQEPSGQTDGPARLPVTRRGLLAGGALMALPLGQAAAQDGADTSHDDLPPAVPEWQRGPGAPLMSPPYGLPSPHEAAVVRRLRHGLPPPPTLEAGFSLTPLQDLTGIITPNGLHYERHHSGVPAIDPDAHRLMVHGLVERPLLFTMADLERFPSVSRVHFLECSGNTQNWGKPDPAMTAQDTHGLLSCSEWTGVRLGTVLAEAGRMSAASWMLAEGADAAAMSRSIPLESVLDDAILAYAQNGERLRPEQGYPLRLLLPGYEGSMNIKWLRRLKLGSAPFETREETATYTELMPDGSVRQFNFIMEPKSVITFPSGGQSLKQPGFYEVTGLAWSGRGKVAKVEVTTNGGETWSEAELQEPILSKCVTRFRLPWRWSGDAVTLASRVTDDTGVVQPSRQDLLRERDVRSYYHYNAVQTWHVAAGGAVTNAG